MSSSGFASHLVLRLGLVIAEDPVVAAEVADVPCGRRTAARELGDDVDDRHERQLHAAEALGLVEAKKPGLVQELLVLRQKHAGVLALLRPLAQRRHDVARAAHRLFVADAREAHFQENLDVPEHRVVGERDLILDGEAAARAAELAELRQRIDEALRVACDRVRGLDRQVVAHAVVLVVVTDRPEIGRALRAAIAHVVVQREAFGREEAHRRVDLGRAFGPALDAARAHVGAPALRASRIAEHDAVDLERRLLGHVAVRDVGFDARWVALERVAEAARR